MLLGDEISAFERRAWATGSMNGDLVLEAIDRCPVPDNLLSLTYGSLRGAAGNSRPYRDTNLSFAIKSDKVSCRRVGLYARPIFRHQICFKKLSPNLP